MKTVDTNLIAKLNKSCAGLAKVSWDDIFDTEEELIQAMFDEHVVVENAPLHKLCRGYEYIKSFRQYYNKHNVLTEAQVRQLKRLASEIAYQIYCNK